MSKKDIIEQTRLAFELIEKLYLEVSYFIKEVEGLMAQEETSFIIGRPAGYGITTRGSTGLEASQVLLWLPKKLAVFFVEEGDTDIKGGMTYTKITPNLKVIYVRIVLSDQSSTEPAIYYGILYDFEKKSSEDDWPSKFEHLMGHIEYAEKRIFRQQESFIYEHEKVRFKGVLHRENIFDLNDSQAILEKIVKPAVQLYSVTGSLEPLVR